MSKCKTSAVWSGFPGSSCCTVISQVFDQAIIRFATCNLSTADYCGDRHGLAGPASAGHLQKQAFCRNTKRYLDMATATGIGSHCSVGLLFVILCCCAIHCASQHSRTVRLSPSRVWPSKCLSTSCHWCVARLSLTFVVAKRCFEI
jgi:hypothetical protein